MSDALSPALPASLLLAHQVAATQVVTPPAPSKGSPTQIDINAPFYISPAISFDPITSIVIVTFRDGEGKVREQIPPAEVLERYQNVDETGIPDPFLRQRRPIAVQTPEPAEKPVPAPAPAANQGSGTIA